MNIFKKFSECKGISFVDTIHKFITFGDFFIAAFPKCLLRRVKRIQQKQEKAITRISKKEKIEVVFFMQTPSIWKYDTLYRLFQQSKLFHPTVVISPYNVHLNYDKAEYFSIMHQTEEFVLSQGYNSISAYDFENKKWRNIKKMLNPDIVFFTKPYKDTLPQYHIYNFPDALTMYVPYGLLCIDNFRASYNLPFHNLLWKFLVETPFQKKFAQQYSSRKGDNAIISGALVTEKLIDPTYVAIDVWKPQPKAKKRIIWAPHHTVDYLFNFSNFLVYCDLMFDLANKYMEQIQFAFKPHPVLKFKLINLWGKEKTEAYYKKWEELENTQLEQGYYIDLFRTSDALIHDCASFTAEYLYTKKPTLFMVRDAQALTHWNEFGRKCFDLHYHAETQEQIEKFITDVVLNGNDPMKTQREEFFNEYLYPKDGILPSQKVVNLLKETLGKE